MSIKKTIDILDQYLVPDLIPIVLNFLKCPLHNREHDYYEHLSCPYQLQEFKFSSVIYGEIYLVIGKRGTGRTTFIRNAISHIKEENSSLAMTLFKHNTYKVDTQIYNYKLSYLRPFLNDKTKRKMIILDSCFTKPIHKEFALLFSGRNYQSDTDYFITTNYPGLITPYTLKDSIRYLVVLKECYTMSKKRLYDNYLKSFFTNYGQFNVLMNNLKPFQALIFDMFMNNIYFYQLKNEKN